MKAINRIFGICVISIFATACSSKQVSSVNDQDITQAQKQKIEQCKENTPSSKKIKKEAVAFSCIASLAISRLVGRHDHKALICVAGGAAGYLIGSSVAERKCEYSVKDNQLEGELSHAHDMKKKFATYMAVLESKHKQQSGQVKALSALGAQGKADQSSIIYVQNKVLKNLNKQRAMLKLLNEERMTKNNTIDMAQSRYTDIETIRKLQTEVKSLLDNIKKMHQNSIALSKLNEVTKDLFVKANK